jgi:hypothetical protein
MSDVTKRIDNWDVKFDTERIKAVLDQKRPSMLAHVQSVFVSLDQMETQVKQTCDAQGAATIFYPFYLGFGREVWSLQQKGISGASLAQECATLIAKWVSRGLSLAVLEAIRSDVFNVSAPVGP